MCIYKGKHAYFSKKDIRTTIIYGCDPMHTVLIRYRNHKKVRVPFRKEEEDETIDLFDTMDVDSMNDTIYAIVQ